MATRDNYPAHRMTANEPRTDRISKNTNVVIQAGVIVTTVIGLVVWIHNRITALELDRAARDERDKYIIQKLDKIADVVSPYRFPVSAVPSNHPNSP